MGTRIEDIRKSDIEHLDDNGLHALRLRFIQVNDKWFGHPGWPDCTESVFMEKYRVLVDEMKKRDISIQTKPIDRVLFAKIATEISHAEHTQIAKPYPNEHACRLKSPSAFDEDSFRRTTRKHDGKEYSVIQGKLKGESTMTEQAYRYNKETWDTDDARAHCKDHDGKFEAAKEEKQAADDLIVKFVGVKKDEDTDERIVMGIVYEPHETDTQGDWSTEEEIRAAAYSFMESGQSFKVNHSDEAPSVSVLESFIAPVDYEIEGEEVKKGSWVMASRIQDDEIWKGIKEGEYTGYSMAGKAIRIEEPV